MTPDEQKELGRLIELARQEDAQAAENEVLKRRLAAAEARLTELTPPQKTQQEKDQEVARSAVVGTGAVLSMIFKMIFGGFALAILMIILVALDPKYKEPRYSEHYATAAEARRATADATHAAFEAAKHAAVSSPSASH